MHCCKMPGTARLYSSPVDEGERFGHLGNAPGLRPIRGKLPSIHPGEVLGPPVLHAGGWLCVHGLGFVCTVTLDQGEHKRLVRGVLIHRLRARWIRGSPRGFLLTRGVGLRLTDGLATSRAKTFGGTVIRPDAILASWSASSLYRRGT
jgi:hypothetical protein